MRYLFVLKNNGGIIAYSSLSLSKIEPQNDSSAFEIDIFVDPDHAGKGSGTKLLNSVICKVSDIPEISSLTAWVHKNNEHSLNLFNSSAFEQSEDHKTYLVFRLKL